MNGARSPAIRRGLLVHKLLQLLPDLAPAERPEAANRLLAATAAGLTPSECSELVASVLDLLERNEFAGLFGPGSRAEQAICGTVGGRRVAGQIDRLLITADEVMVVDLKSNRRPPASVAEVAVGYLAQLATYRSLLRALYPTRRIRSGLLWTEGPRLDWIADEILDRHNPDLP